jgi:hypothetical protein
VIGPTPLLDFFKRGEVAKDVRLSAAKGELAPRAYEQLSILMLLVDDAEFEIRDNAEATLGKISKKTLGAFLSRTDTPGNMIEFFANRGIVPDGVPQDSEDDAPLIDSEYIPEFDEDAMVPSWQKESEAESSAEAAQEQDDVQTPAAAASSEGAAIAETPPADGDAAAGDEDEELDPELAEAKDQDGNRLSASQLLAKMGMMQKLKAAVKGTREMRSILIRDPNKMIAAAVLSSPKLTDAEVASFAKMQNVSEDVLRVIAANRSWTKSYTVILALTKNPKTPVAMSVNFLQRLTTKDVAMIAVDRNVSEALRINARKKAAAARAGGG